MKFEFQFEGNGKKVAIGAGIVLALIIGAITMHAYKGEIRYAMNRPTDAEIAERQRQNGMGSADRHAAAGGYQDRRVNTQSLIDDAHRKALGILGDYNDDKVRDYTCDTRDLNIAMNRKLFQLGELSEAEFQSKLPANQRQAEAEWQAKKGPDDPKASPWSVRNAAAQKLGLEIQPKYVKMYEDWFAAEFEKFKVEQPGRTKR